MNTALVRPLILIVEDMASLALAYSSQLEASGFSCVVVDTGRGFDSARAQIRGILRATAMLPGSG